MLNEQLDDDTLFLVFEEDWRLHPDGPDTLGLNQATDVTGTDLDPRAVLLTEANAVPLGGAAAAQPRAGHRGRSRDRGASAGTAAPVTGRAQRLPKTGAAQPAKEALGSSNFYIPLAGTAAPSAAAGSPSVIEDLVSIVTLASRTGCGDLVWLTWQPGQEARPKPVNKIRSGAMLIALTRDAARAILAAVLEGAVPEGHWDNKLLAWLQAGGLARWSYITPPIGNYRSHVSGCERQYATAPRPSCWSYGWCVPGTRRREDPMLRDKWLCVMHARAPMEWKVQVDLDKLFHILDWRVRWAVPGHEPNAMTVRRASASAAATSSRTAPAAAASSTSSTAAAVASHADAAAEEEQSTRNRRHMRKLTMRWKFRTWAEEGQEAVRPVRAGCSLTPFGVIVFAGRSLDSSTCLAF